MLLSLLKAAGRVLQPSGTMGKEKATRQTSKEVASVSADEWSLLETDSLG